MRVTVNGVIAVNILVPALAWLPGAALPAGFKPPCRRRGG
jgi:hypothetical protein